MIKILAVGKSKEKAMLAMIDEYRKRLSPFTKLEIIEVNDEHAPQTNSDAENEQVKEKEGKKTAVTGQGWRLCHPARPVGEKCMTVQALQKKWISCRRRKQLACICHCRFTGTKQRDCQPQQSALETQRSYLYASDDQGTGA